MYVIPPDSPEMLQSNSPDRVHDYFDLFRYYDFHGRDFPGVLGLGEPKKRPGTGCKD